MILGTSAIIDVVVTDSKGNAVPNVSVAGASPLGNTLVATNGTSTNNSGQIRFNYTANTAGMDALVFSGAGASASPSPALVVSGEDFSFVAPTASSTVPVGTPQVVQVRLRNGGLPQAGKVIHFAATGGTLTSADATTNADGLASTTLSSNSAGPVTVQASVDGSTTSTTLPLVVIATVPAKLVLQVSPTAIGPNASLASGNQAQLVAKVTDRRAIRAGPDHQFSRQTDPSGGTCFRPRRPRTRADRPALPTVGQWQHSQQWRGVARDCSQCSIGHRHCYLDSEQTRCSSHWELGNTITNLPQKGGGVRHWSQR
jgi:adhesin/invasin